MNRHKLYLSIISVVLLLTGWISFGVIVLGIGTSDQIIDKISIKQYSSIQKLSAFELAIQLHSSLDRYSKSYDRYLFLSEVKGLIEKGADPFYAVTIKWGKKTKKISFFNRIYNHFSSIDASGVPLREEVLYILKDSMGDRFKTALKKERNLKDIRDLFFMDIKRIGRTNTLLSYIERHVKSEVISIVEFENRFKKYSSKKSVSSIRKLINNDFIKGLYKFQKGINLDSLSQANSPKTQRI